MSANEMTVFERMELEDEKQVLAEIKGSAIAELVYQFRQDGKLVTGLSLAGVRETTREMNTRGIARISISDKEPVWIESEFYYECRAYAFDARSGSGWWGLSKQAKNMKVHAKDGNGQWLREADGSWIFDEAPDEFAAQKCMSKAQRNALRGLIPEWFVKEIIAQFVKGGFTKAGPTPDRAPRKGPDWQTVEGEYSDNITEKPEPPELDKIPGAALPEGIKVPSKEGNGLPTVNPKGSRLLADWAKAHGYRGEKVILLRAARAEGWDMHDLNETTFAGFSAALDRALAKEGGLIEKVEG